MLYASMKNCNYMSTGTISKILALFYQKNIYMHGYMTRNALNDPKIVKCSLHKFRELFCPNQEFLALKLAEICPNL